MRLERRLARVERALAPAMPAACPHCGQGDGHQPPRYRLEFDGDNDRSGPDRCEGCGRALVYRVCFDREG